MVAESNPSTMKACATVAFLILEVVRIVGVHGVTDQPSTRHGHRSELPQQPTSRLPVSGQPEIPAHEEQRLPSLIATKGGEVGKSHIADASGSTHRYGSWRRIHGGHNVP